MTERRNPGCAFGPCNDSKRVGGLGCHLCDDIATLPQRLDRPDVELAAPDAETTTKATAKQAQARRPATKAKAKAGVLF